MYRSIISRSNNSDGDRFQESASQIDSMENAAKDCQRKMNVDRCTAKIIEKGNAEKQTKISIKHFE